MVEKVAKKKCFIITPIGNETDKIRRHIDGIIDAAIIPALNDEFEVIVSHRICETGSITKQIISEIYNADLVIANITEKNPNVMYELAFRHSVGKPAIMIADKETNLPADIISERTIFYYNDAKGVLELREELKNYIKEIDYTKNSSPILSALSEILYEDSIINISFQKDPKEGDALDYIVQRLTRIEAKVDGFSASNEYPRKGSFVFVYLEHLGEFGLEHITPRLKEALAFERNIKDLYIRDFEEKHVIRVILDLAGKIDVPGVVNTIIEVLEEAGYVRITVRNKTVNANFD